jgi:hypothetical protein
MTRPATPDLDDSWKPASLREAEAQLNETMAKSREVIKQVEQKLKQLPDVDHTAKPEDITAMKAAAEKPNASAELRALKKKVDAGELSWKDVLEGKALKDETVRAAMGARLGEMREIYEEAQAGATLEEILEARGVTPGGLSSGGTATYPQAAPSSTKPSEDDYFSDNHVLSQRPTPPPPPAAATPPAPPPQAPPRPTRPAPPRTQPPAREETSEDYFENPLASRGGQPKRTEPPRTRRPSRRDETPDDDDYFGGPLLR